MSKGDDVKYKKDQRPAANGIVKIASLLQKALESGRSNQIEMSEVSRYISYYVKAQIDESSMYMDYILDSKNGSNFKQMRNEFVKILDEIDENITNGYEKLLAPNGSINKGLLERLIQIDTEITSGLNILRNILMSAKNGGEITDYDRREIIEIIGELSTNISERKKIK
ncbi:MAG: hypothetical protein QXU32_05035 [Nitrososphaerales archaeon]